LLAAIAVSLLAGLAGGLLRVGVTLPATAGSGWLAQAGLAHAALMIGAFMGSVVGVERAVAVKLRSAWIAPLASAAAGPALLAGGYALGGRLLVLAGLAFLAVNLVLLRRQRADHTRLLLASACAWLVGNVLYAAGAPTGTVLPWWFAFLVVTIAAERLEMTRLMRRRPGARTALLALLALLFAGAALSALHEQAGGIAYGAALMLLAAWLLTFDIARRTVKTEGLARYMAVCLLGGYLWLGAAGGAWIATAVGLPWRDAALHALGLGFILSMMMGHAPVILPAVAGVKLKFGPWFYLPLAALHLSLLWRLLAGAADRAARAEGAAGNAATVAVFAATIAAAALAWRRRHAPGPRDADTAP
jgi:hypothetical protein